ncbi:hypothetical protein PQR71_21315 [Paraburkholderia fungorum]|uniref:hypothetical protein n=2 Tax=Paraburkholderia fungorum TaxID=134537 RepID=UPI0038B74FDF
MLDSNQTANARNLPGAFSNPATTGYRSDTPSSGRSEARLPFTVRVVDNDEALTRALRMRQAAYHRHVPEFARTMDQEEPYDRDPGGLVLLAESRLDRSPVGTMRIQSNCFRPLALEQSLELPDWLSGRLVGATRLGVEAGEPGRMVKLGLFKALYLYCVREQIDWMAIAARTPLDRQYAALLFRDVYGDKEFIPLAHATNIPHRIMAFEVATTERRWGEARHPLYEFMLVTHHPDIDLSAAPSLNWVSGATPFGDQARPFGSLQNSADAAVV